MHRLNYHQVDNMSSSNTSMQVSTSKRSSRRQYNTSVNDKTRAMKELIDALLLHIKAFDGDIFGGTIRDYRIGGTVYVKDINCRLDNLVLQVFIQSLQVYFDVQEISVDVGGHFVDYIKRIKVSRKNEDASCLLYLPCGDSIYSYVYVDIVVVSRAEWMRLPCDFDVNLLAENSHSLYMRVPYISLNRFTDKINHVIERIKNNTFCSLESSYTKTPEQVKTLVDKACKFVTRGWIMDDTLLGDTTWVVGTWHIMTNGLKMVRKGYNQAAYDKMLSKKECSICNEEFKRTDVVINTKCNHNFHWQEPLHGSASQCLSRSGNSTIVCCKGLKEWVSRGNITCPICRQLMF